MAKVEMQVELVQTRGITHFSFHQKPRPNPTAPKRLHLCPVTAKAVGAYVQTLVPTASARVAPRVGGLSLLGALRI